MHGGLSIVELPFRLAIRDKVLEVVRALYQPLEFLGMLVLE